MILDDFLPRWHFRSRHQRRVAEAVPAVLAACREVTGPEVRLFRLLTSLRTLPARMAGLRGSIPPLLDPPAGLPLLAAAQRSGFVLLSDDGGSEMVLGSVGQFWRVSGGRPLMPLRSPSEFLEFAEPGYAKAAFSFRAEGNGAGTLLHTETRIWALDEDSRRRFARYWWVIRPGSGLVRRAWLRAIDRRATTAVPMEGGGRTLPRGQRAKTDFPRYGLVRFAPRWPKPSPEPRLEVLGDVATPCEIPLSELAALPRREQISDLHCVATWSRVGIRWSGYRFRDLYENVILPRANPHPDVRHVWLRGADGFSASLFLEDALAEDVLIADAIDGQPLPLEHGAPARVVAPAHYGYKSVRHLSRIGLYRELRPGVGGPLVHPRARVEREERSRYLPGAFYRRVYRMILPLTLWLHRHLGAPRRPGAQP